MTAELIERLRLASHDERLSTGALYAEAADALTRLQQEVNVLRAWLVIETDAANKGDLARATAGGMEMEIAELREAIAALREDAERYRWLRENGYKAELTYGYTAVGLDSAIDAAIAAKGQPCTRRTPCERGADGYCARCHEEQTP